MLRRAGILDRAPLRSAVGVTPWTHSSIVKAMPSPFDDAPNVKDPPPMVLPAAPAEPFVSESALSTPAPGLMTSRFVAGSPVIDPELLTPDGQR